VTDGPSPTDPADLIAGIMVDDQVAVIDELLAVEDDVDIPPEWDQVLHIAADWMEGDEAPSMPVRIAGKLAMTWGRQTIARDPAKAREAVIDMMSRIAHALHVTAEELQT